MILFAVFPGFLPSRVDGDLHYTSARELIQLYEVNPAECLVFRDERDYFMVGIDYMKALHPLQPSFWGRYGPVPEIERQRTKKRLQELDLNRFKALGQVD